MKSLTVDESVCRNREKALTLEWLDTNGLGGYASSTILGCNTRKYHGLLVGNLNNPKGRYVLLAWLEDAVAAHKKFFLSGAQYPGFFFPGDEQSLSEFRLDNFPMFTYEVDGIRIRKSIMMVSRENRVLIRYEIEKLPKPGSLRIRPFLAYRGYHGLTRENRFIRKDAEELGRGLKVQPYDGMPPLIMETDVEAKFSASPVWHNNFEYRVEKERGFDWNEDLFCPGVLEIPVREGDSVIFSAATVSSPEKPDDAWTREEARRAAETARDEGVAAKIGNEEDRINVGNLITSGRQFSITSPSGRPAIIAGYHWFTDWGRDTLISLPGLTFFSGRADEGKAILASIGAYEKNGLLPNFFSDDETENAYNTVDTSLWYFWAVEQLLMSTGDTGFIKSRLWPVMKRILKGYMDGTAFGIGMSENGLLHAGDRGTHITWMDAMVEGKPVTPRFGYPVEINALWYNAVCFADELCQLFGESGYHLNDLIPRIRKSFFDTFWIEEGAYLGDVFCDGLLDRAVRPNQILAVSLPHSPLDLPHWKGVLDKVKKHLLTPVGLRTLSPEDREYRHRYEGDGKARDAAYHQGTVWPWLIGHFGEACIKAAEDRAEAKRFLVNYLREFLRRHMKEAGIGCVSEIFDGDPPHRPNGCISQAWSVAELIRLHMLLSNIPDD